MIVGAPSRRLCNLPYCLFQTLLVNTILLYCLIIDRLVTKRPTHMVEAVINYGQLQYFVYANLLTGLTNLSFWTYYETVAFSMAAMIVYFVVETILLNHCRKCRFKASF